MVLISCNHFVNHAPSYNQDGSNSTLHLQNTTHLPSAPVTSVEAGNGPRVGLNAYLFCDYVQFIADRRLERIGLSTQYGSSNPFPWMSETIDLGKEKNLFETRVTEYQSASALSGD